MQIEDGMMPARPRRQPDLAADQLVLVGGIARQLMELFLRQRQSHCPEMLGTHDSPSPSAGLIVSSIVQWPERRGTAFQRAKGPIDMAMKVGIAGFAGSGKSTVFQWL